MWDENWSQNRADSFKLQASLLVTKTSAENKKLCFYKRRFQLKIRIFAFTNQVFHGTVKAVCAGLQWPFEPKNCPSCNGRSNQKSVWAAMAVWTKKLFELQLPFEPKNLSALQWPPEPPMLFEPKNYLSWNGRLNHKTVWAAIAVWTQKITIWAALAVWTKKLSELQWPFEPKNCLSCNDRLNQTTVWAEMAVWTKKLSDLK